MNRQELKALIKDSYGVSPDQPWMRSPNHEVFRHKDNKKWFALIMDVPRNKLGLSGSELIDVVNFKYDQFLLGSLLKEDGFFPGYHMNKSYWISVALDGTAPDDKIKMLLDMSYEATLPRKEGINK